MKPLTCDSQDEVRYVDDCPIWLVLLACYTTDDISCEVGMDNFLHDLISGNEAFVAYEDDIECIHMIAGMYRMDFENTGLDPEHVFMPACSYEAAKEWLKKIDIFKDIKIYEYRDSV